jgi:two-component system, cell cycle sensor histidine kinase and response regulator CckA
MIKYLQQCKIKTKLMFIILVVSLPVVLAVCFQLGAQYRRDYFEAEHDVQVVADAIAAQHEANVNEIRTLLATLAHFPVVIRKDRESCNRLVKMILKQNPSIHNIGIADIDGSIIATGIDARFTIEDRKYFRDALEKKRFSIGEYTVSRAIPKPALHFAQPVIDSEGSVLAVLFAAFDLERFYSIFSAHQLPPESALYITDQSGIVVYSYPYHPKALPGMKDRSDLFQRMSGPSRSGVFSDYGKDDVRRILAFKRLQLHSDEPPSLYIRISITKEEALSRVHRYIAYSAGMFGLALLIAFWCSHVLGRRFLADPIENLSSALQATRHGDFSVRSGFAEMDNEIGLLAKSFDTMAASLEAELRERDLAEAALRESELQFKVIYERSPLTVALLGLPEGVFLKVNKAFADMFGFEREEVIGKTAMELGIWVSEEDRSRYLNALKAGGGSVHDFDLTMRRKDGTLINVLFSGDVLEIGGRMCAYNVVQEITEKKRIERSLVESERRFRELLENVHMVAVTLDRDGNITFCNDFLLTLTGWQRVEVFGKNWFDSFVSEDSLEQEKALFAETMSTSALVFHDESRIRTRNGQQRMIVWDNTLLKNAEGVVIGAAKLGMDVTDYRSIESQLLQSQKMEAIGQLAGGVAHDFNNLLTPILGFAELIRKELIASNGKSGRVDNIILAASKARDLTRQLLSFGRKQIFDMRVIDLNDVISAFVDILRRTIREDIDIQMKLSLAPVLIRADKTQIEQVVMNLLVNAQDAITGKGVIVLETAPVLLDEKSVLSHSGTRPGKYIVLRVKDTGCGMEPAVLDHIFEPFFTTKAHDKGTGLGLATIYGIVKQHEGSIQVNSEPGKGSEFNLYFPAVASTAVMDVAEAAATLSASKQSGTILLVEDNLMVRMMVNDMLCENGYRVIEAEDPFHALELAAENRIDLLVSDVIMPEVSGPELYKRILQLYSETRVLFMSGYTFNVVAEDLLLDENVNYIQKPFDGAEMLSKIARILDGKGGCPE